MSDNGNGVKYDNEKPRMDLVPNAALSEIAKVLGFGAAKYGDHNWRGGFKWGRLAAASRRHIAAFMDGKDLDSESGLPHLAHACCGLMFLLELSLDPKYKHLDNRYAGEFDPHQEPEPKLKSSQGKQSKCQQEGEEGCIYWPISRGLLECEFCGNHKREW